MSDIQIGERYGLLVVEGDSGNRNSSGSIIWRCHCWLCGKIHLRSTNDVKKMKKCTCVLREETRLRFTTHGQSGSRIHKTWLTMKRRCEETGFRDFHYYGGRGIRVCPEWQSFQRFMQDMGIPKSDKMTIERIDPDGDYCLANCKWADRKEQANNTRRNHFVRYRGLQYTLAQLASHPDAVAAGVSYTLLRARRRYDWGVEEAVNTPPGQRGYTPVRRRPF